MQHISRHALECAPMPADTRRPAHRNIRTVGIWLLGIAVLICAMIVLGGATRLTGSGLSITQWRPITGILPPLSEAQWQEAFALYRQIPEYRLVNPDMGMEGFQRIYWWEWSHRAFGRLVGVAFILPFLWFLLRGYLSAALLGRLIAILLLGALQGVVGWYMVASGLHARIDVHPVRLALHLGMAFLLLGLCWHGGLALLRPPPHPLPPAWRTAAQHPMAAMILAAVFAQIVLGALVAGGRGDALGGGEFPPEIAVPSAQSNALLLAAHQALAYVLLGVILLYAGFARSADRSRVALALAIVLQAGLGIFALESEAAVLAGLLHQSGAVLVFLLAVAHFCALGRNFS